MIQAVVHIYENISEKKATFDKEGASLIEKSLLKLAEEGLPSNQKGEPIASIDYIQSATGDCDFIMIMKSTNVEDLMSAINIIRQIDQVLNTETHVGTLVFKKK